LLRLGRHHRQAIADLAGVVQALQQALRWPGLPSETSKYVAWWLEQGAAQQ
jgi:hypothetical protein